MSIYFNYSQVKKKSSKVNDTIQAILILALEHKQIEKKYMKTKQK